MLNLKPIQSIPKKLIFGLCLACAITTASIRATANQLNKDVNLPADKTVIGDTFIDSWLSIRNDIDAIVRPTVSPLLLDQWFSAMSPTLLHDALQISTNPQISLYIAKELVKRKSPRTLDSLLNLEARYKETDISKQLLALRIAAGDKETELQLIEHSRAGESLLAINASATLAAAGKQIGLNTLRKLVRTSKHNLDRSIKELGRYGALEDYTLITQAIPRLLSPTPALSARAEITIRHKLPELYRSLAEDDPTGRRHQVDAGLYTSWFIGLEKALNKIEEGTANSLISSISRSRISQTELDNEVWKRHLKILESLLQDFRQRAQPSSTSAKWPDSFEDAKLDLARLSLLKSPSPQQFAKRLTMAIALCSWTGQKLQYDSMKNRTFSPSVLSIGADRAVDNNLATSWQIYQSGNIVIELEKETDIDGMWIASFCPQTKGTGVSHIKITSIHTGGEAGKTQTTAVKKLKNTKYFQHLTISKRGVHSLKFEAFSMKDATQPSCISEIRLSLHNRSSHL